MMRTLIVVIQAALFFTGALATCSCYNGVCIPVSNTAATTNQICVCNRGFTKASFSNNVCMDINECELTDGQVCGAGVCMNTQGSFTCWCDPRTSIPWGNQYCMGRQQYPASGFNMQTILNWRILDEIF